MFYKHLKYQFPSLQFGQVQNGILKRTLVCVEQGHNLQARTVRHMLKVLQQSDMVQEVYQIQHLALVARRINTESILPVKNWVQMNRISLLHEMYKEAQFSLAFL
ncbi:hypothetical protein X975_02580, partial [Stegodyphus mimosarum]